MLRLTATAPARVPQAPTQAVWRPLRPRRLVVHGLITAAAFVCYILGQALAGDGGALPTLFALVGVASCGWAWLLTRALFDPAEHDARWPRIVVAIVWLTGAVSILAGPAQGLVAVAADNAYALSGSAALLMIFVEPLLGFRRTLPRAERRFRIVFLGVYAVLVAVSTLFLDGIANVASPGVIKGACALAGLAAGAGAVWFRLRRPLPRVQPPAPSRRLATSDDRRLAERIVEVVRDHALCVSPDLKVADLAARLAEPEHRVTQSITAALGFANFNRLINHYRIERARRMLVDPALADRPILVIAFDCGFASLGPFNRAFKAETGVTPRAYRGLARAAGSGSAPA
jgi:AraC-like DNA-binding protein